jgi:tyrosine-protein kinase Etk/Wzc
MSTNSSTSNEDRSLTGESQPLAGPSAGQDSLNDMSEDSGVFEVLLVIARKKWQAVGGTLAGGILTGVVAFLIPNTYTASAVLMVPPQSQSSASALLGQVGGLVGMAGAGALGIKSPGDVQIGLLGSRTVADALIDKFNLQALYRVKTRTAARTALAEHRRFSTGKDSLIRIDVDDRDPKRAADIANGYVTELNAKNTVMAVSDANQKRLFLENRLREEKEALARAEDSMKNLQQRSGLMEVENQAHVAISAIARVKSELVAEEVMLQRMRIGATAQNSAVVGVEAELGELRAQLKKLEDSPAAQSSGDPLVPLSRMPSAGLDYLRQMRELRFHEFLFELLTKQYEAARLDESKEAPSLPVVDWAVPPEKKSGPKRPLIVLEGLVGAGIFSCALIWLLHSMQLSGEGHKLSQLKRVVFA